MWDARLRAATRRTLPHTISNALRARTHTRCTEHRAALRTCVLATHAFNVYVRSVRAWTRLATAQTVTGSIRVARARVVGARSPIESDPKSVRCAELVGPSWMCNIGPRVNLVNRVARDFLTPPPRFDASNRQTNTNVTPQYSVTPPRHTTHTPTLPNPSNNHFTSRR